MKEKSFHFRSYLHKKYNPQPHSCAVCKNQPIFPRVPDHNRIVKPSVWQWKPGVRDCDIWGAEVDDVFEGTNKHTEALKMSPRTRKLTIILSSIVTCFVMWHFF